MEMGKKVLYIAGGRNVSGQDPGRKITSILNNWGKMGYEVRAVFGGDFPEGVNSIGGRGFGNSNYYQKWYRRVGLLNPFIHSCSERRDIQHNEVLLKSLESLCAKFSPDLIWERSFRLHSPGLEMSKRLSIPYVLEWKDHLVDYRLSLFRGKALRMERLKNQKANYIVVESGVLRHQLEHEGVEGGKIIVAHNAVEADQFARDEKARARVRSELGINEEKILVGYLGSYAFYHDTARLVLAADILKKNEIAGKLKILMVGAGKEYAESRKLAEDLGLLDNILVMKPGVPKNEVPGILAALDIAVLPGSTDIICPIKVQEYMACELPSVVPDYGCNREVLSDGESGLLFNPQDATDLAQKIMLLAENRELRLEIGKRARQDVVRQFSWEATWGAALENVLERERVKFLNPTDKVVK
jgi:glycosyltransferase involved in cell wall biosynthesis